jgi:hypothetical protein
MSLFEDLREFEKIVVTGPQRAGTTICSRMIAHDLGYEHVDETAIRIHDLHILKLVLRVGRRFVVQCPALCSQVHRVADERTAVVMMRRPLADILASQARIGWALEGEELFRYGVSDGIAAEVKYRFWDREQKTVLAHPFEVEYESLRDHPLWVPRELRSRFAPKQTSLSETGR